MKKILIVDDAPMNIRILEELLETQYQVFVAENGQEAVWTAKDEIPDLILLDVVMPGLNGFEVCYILKSGKETAGIPVIFITASNSKEDTVKGFEAGGQDYITKPFNPQELFARIQTHLELASSRKKLEQYAKELERKNRELSEAVQKLDRLSQVDDLTNLLNRRSMHEKIRAEAARSERHGRSFSLAVADIDNFKKINDTYGHDCGDKVLKTFAATLKNKVRSSDLVSRWGGEEFLLLFPETNMEEARIACEKIRAAVTSVEYIGLEIKVTATFGVAEYKSANGVDELMKVADEALYHGKEAGKNCVMVKKSSGKPYPGDGHLDTEGIV